jgi:hypothetical protein
MMRQILLHLRHKPKEPTHFLFISRFQTTLALFYLGLDRVEQGEQEIQLPFMTKELFSPVRQQGLISLARQ